MLVFFGAMLGLKSCSPREVPKADDKRVEALEARLEDLRREVTALKVKLGNVESAVRQAPAAAERPQSPGRNIDDQNSRYVNETIASDNVGDRAVWRQTNRPNVYLVDVTLEKEPVPGSLAVTTDKGVMPPSSYHLTGLVLSMVFQETQEEFSANNGIITIRYLPRQ